MVKDQKPDTKEQVTQIKTKLRTLQITAESVLFEMTPDHPSLNNRNRRPVNQRVHTPQDVRHGMQLAYDLIANVRLF